MNRRVFGAYVAVAIVLGACTADPTIAGSRDADGSFDRETAVGVFGLRVGDCLRMPVEEDDAENVTEVTGVPCHEPHTGEVLDLVVMDEDPGSDYPGVDLVLAEAQDVCVERFDQVTGLDFVSDPDWDLFMLYPTEETWTEVDDREIVCVAVPLDAAPTTDVVPRT